MKRTTLGCLLATLMLLPLEAAAQTPVPVPITTEGLARDVAILRREARVLRADLSRAKKEATAAQKAADQARTALDAAAAEQQREGQRAQNQTAVLTGAVVVLGLLTCLTLFRAGRARSGSDGGREDVAQARDRIARLRTELRADEARLAELHAGKDPQPAP